MSAKPTDTESEAASPRTLVGIPALPTLFLGVQFRSRTEAKWAAVFEALRWPWEYESLDLDFYIPDFVLRFPRGLVMAEVKPASTAVELLAFAPKVTGAGWPGEVLMLGASLFLPTTEAVPSLGLYSQFEESPDGPVLGAFDHAILHRCLGCKAISFHHATGDWRCAVSGCSDGNTLVDIIEPHELRALWNAAGARVQWRSPVDNLPSGLGR
jgi:hypothetical protein